MDTVLLTGYTDSSVVLIMAMSGWQDEEGRSSEYGRESSSQYKFELTSFL